MALSIWVKSNSSVQEKYRRRKARKYTTRASVMRPTARSVAELYSAKAPQKVSGLRVDTLALLLSLANVGPQARLLVVDAVGGLVSAACLERMGGAASNKADWKSMPSPMCMLLIPRPCKLAKTSGSEVLDEMASCRECTIPKSSIPSCKLDACGRIQNAAWR